MTPAPLPENEKERIAALLRFDVLDTEFETTYDELTQLAASICGAPISLISLVDSERQWFKSKVGLGCRQTPRDYAFCSHALFQKDVFIVEDAQQDERFADNPLVVSDPNIRFYAGAPLITSEGEILGTLCVIDRIPRKLTPDQEKALEVLAKQVISQLELRLTFKRLQNCATHLCEVNGARDKLYYIIAHDLHTPFKGIIDQAQFLVNELGSEEPDLEGALHMAEDINTSGLSTLKLVNNLLEWAMCKAGPMEYRLTIIKLDLLIGQVIEFASVLARSKSIELCFEGIPDIKVQADRYMIFSVILNLLHNAIKFTPNHGKIQVVLSASETKAGISVIDTGPGMAEEIRASLFSLETVIGMPGGADEEGSGLGLLLCKQFVEMNGGEIEALSKEGKGSIFRFSLTRSAAPIRTLPQAPARKLETGLV